jgi:thiamine transporter
MRDEHTALARSELQQVRLGRSSSRKVWSMPRARTQILVEIALTVAMAAVLYGLFHVVLPINAFGGEISLTMVPIIVLSLRRGLIPGVVAGAVFGLFMLVVEPYIVHPAQLLLDYPIAFGLVGLAGIGSPAYRTALDTGRTGRAAAIAALSSVLGAAGRFAAHVVSGAVFFAANAPKGQPVLIYSIVYNASYIVPSAILSIPITVLVALALERAVPVASGLPRSA